MKIEVKNISKKFNKTEVIKNVSATFESGKIYGIIGRNGSGKSVFLKMLCSFYIPSSGEILQDGYNYIANNDFPKSTRALIEGPNFIPDLTGYENLKLIASIQNSISNDQILETMKKVNVYEEKDKKYGEYSLGTKQKLGIVQVLMEDPKFMILDEAFNGIDKKSVEKIKEIIKEEKKKDKLIIITSHILDDIEELSDEIYEFDAGELTKYDNSKNKI